MQVFETAPVNRIIWTTLSTSCVNGWSIANDPKTSRWILVQKWALVIMDYEAGAKQSVLSKAKAFAENNTFTKASDPETETHFLASQDLFFYRRQFSGSGVAFGKAAHLASAKVLANDIEWLKDLILEVGPHSGTAQLNEHAAFLTVCSQSQQTCES